MQKIKTLLAAALCVAGIALAARPAAAQTTERVSVASDGTPANDLSASPSISADGRFVAFSSFAGNLVPNDTNDTIDVFVRDRQSGTTSRVSVASDGSQTSSGASPIVPSISADGRFVAFYSAAPDVVPGDTNNTDDVFVHDRQTGATSRVSIASDGTQGNNASVFASISADGRFVAFVSFASNLVPGDTNNTYDVFVHDRQTGTTSRVSVASDGTQANSGSLFPRISADGRFVTFYSSASNLVPGDTNNAYDVFVRDRQSGTTSRVSIASDGAQGNGHSTDPAISADGRFVAFVSDASNLVAGDTNSTGDVFVHDRQTGATTRVSVASDGTQGNGPSSAPSISANGRFIGFGSDAANLVAGDTNGEPDVFVHDRQTGTTARVSVASDGSQGVTIFHSDTSFSSSISDDGRFVAFDSDHENLVAGDRNQTSDVFVHDQGPQEVITFIGFERPIKNLPFTNSVNAGRSIPIKWQLTDEAGRYIRDLAIVKSLRFANVACDSQDTDYENPMDAQAAGASKLRYDSADEHFIYTWKTQRSMHSTCAVLILTLADNQQHFARFMLK